MKLKNITYERSYKLERIFQDEEYKYEQIKISVSIDSEDSDKEVEIWNQIDSILKERLRSEIQRYREKKSKEGKL